MRQSTGATIYKLSLYGLLMFAISACSEMKLKDEFAVGTLSSVYCSSAANLKAQSAADTYTSKLRLNLTYLSENNQQFSKANAAGLAALKNSASTMSISSKANLLNSMTIPAKTELVGTIDKECVALMDRDTLSVDLAENGNELLKDLRFESIVFETTADLSIEDLQDVIDEDPCIEVVSEQQYIQKFAGDVIAQAPGDPDPSIGRQRHLDSIGFERAMNTIIGGDLISEFVIIAIVDTGVDYTHEDLSFQMWTDSNGRYGTDLANNDNDPMDDSGHGTHVAGLAAATYKNGIGGSGVMGQWSRIMAVKALGANGSGNIADVANGVRYAVQNGADVVNMSLGAPAASSLLESAVKEAVQAGVFVVAAAGNNGLPLDDDNFFSPAGYAKDIQGLVSVGSYDTDTTSLSTFSNFSSSRVEIAGPGSTQSKREPFEGLLSTIPASLSAGSPYARLSGTSMASPVVAGAMGLLIGALKSNRVNYSVAELETALMASATSSSRFASTIKGGRLLNADRLSQLAVNAIESGSLCAD